MKLPTPRYIVFYNGTQEEPDRIELRLSDSFIRKEDEPCIECRALVLNINYGHNQELMGPAGSFTSTHILSKRYGNSWGRD